jgi:hypothetical protein
VAVPCVVSFGVFKLKDNISTFTLLLAAIKKQVSRFVSASSRHVKKRRHLSAISAQISFVGQETRFNGSSVKKKFPAAMISLYFHDERLRTEGEIHILVSQLFTEDEEVIADVLLSLSQIPSLSGLTADKATADTSNTNVASTSYSEGWSALFILSY